MATPYFVLSPPVATPYFVLFHFERGPKLR